MTTTETVLAYHGDPALKAAVLAQMADHRAAERLVTGTYWSWTIGRGTGTYWSWTIGRGTGTYWSWTIGRGCAVGCLTHDPDGGHEEYPVRWGIPEELAWLEDSIFETLPLEDALAWPERFLAAIEPGADLSGVHAAWSDAVDEVLRRWAWPEPAWVADQLIAFIEAAPVAAEPERVAR